MPNTGEYLSQGALEGVIAVGDEKRRSCNIVMEELPQRLHREDIMGNVLPHHEAYPYAECVTKCRNATNVEKREAKTVALVDVWETSYELTDWTCMLRRALPHFYNLE
jgi:hypothetical protein